MEVPEENNLQAILDAIMNLKEDPVNDSGLCVTSAEESTDDESLLKSLLTKQDSRNIRPTPYTKTKMRRRKRPNNEINYLRDQVVELEVLAATLHDSAKRPKLLQEEKMHELNTVYWKFHAEINKRGIKAALLENQKLRAMLDGRLRVAKAYQSAIDKHKEYQHAAIDEVLEGSGVARVKHEFLSRLCFQQGSFHHSEVRVLPFSVSDVTRAVQNCLAQRVKSESSKQHRCRKLVQSYNYFKAVTVDMVQVPGASPAEVTARLLQWCVVQPERTVVTWSGFFEYDGRRYVRLFEKIWVSIEPIRLKKKNNTLSKQYGSILRIVVHLTPVESEFELDNIEEMADVITTAYHRNAEMVYQALLAQLAPRRG